MCLVRCFVLFVRTIVDVAADAAMMMAATYTRKGKVGAGLMLGETSGLVGLTVGVWDGSEDWVGGVVGCWVGAEVAVGAGAGVFGGGVWDEPGLLNWGTPEPDSVIVPSSV